ncbi:50S ribosomal protein L13 [Candidatus Woesearchaeota archaeon]|nr:50S ribosomal protein L13 [Candidatus Woesearchaeota archaeon]
MAELIIDATNAIVGRLASYIAKQALLGNSVVVLNSEKALFSGDPKVVAEKYRLRKSEIGRPQKGPFIPSLPERFLKRVIRGMLPHKQGRGRDAFKRIMCYRSVPSEFEGKKAILPSVADSTKRKFVKFVSVQQVCKYLGGNK